MATSPEIVRQAIDKTRPLADDILDAIRDAVIVVDAHSPQLPLLLVNAAARRCFQSDAHAEAKVDALTDRSLYSLLGAATEGVIATVLSALSERHTSVTRVLPWRFTRGEIPLSTDIKLLASAPAEALVMLTFPEPSREPLRESGARTAKAPLPRDLLLLDRELTVTYANWGAVRAAGAPQEGLLGLSALILAPTSAIPRDALTGALAGEPFHDDAIGMVMPGEPTRWFDVDVQPLKDTTGIVGVAVLFMEVTERRRQRRPVALHQKPQVAPKRIRDLISVTAVDGTLLLVSSDAATVALGTAQTQTQGHEPEHRLGGNPFDPMARQRLGGSQFDSAHGQRLGTNLFDTVHADDIAVLRAKFAELSDGRLNAFCGQFRVRQADDSYRWLEWSCTAALDNPAVRGIVVDTRDITERKLAEARYAQREEVFKLAADAVNGIIFDWDLVRGVVQRSSGVQDVLGLESKDLETVASWAERIHPEDRSRYDAKIAAALADGRGWTVNYRIRDTRGRYRSIMERGLIQRGAGDEPIRAIGCAVDVSEIKRLTDLLGETQRIARVGGWEYNYGTRELEWTDEMFRIFETTPAEFDLSWSAMWECCLPESRDRLRLALDAAEAAEQSSPGDFDLELEILTRNANRTWVRIVGHVEKLDGRPVRAFGSLQNVQDRRLAQIALENSTDWLKLSMSMAHMQAWRWHRATDRLEFANGGGQPLGLARAFPGINKLLAKVHPKDRAGVRRAIDQAFERRSELHTEFRLKTAHGFYRAYAAIAQPLFDATGQPTGLVGVTQDVTQRHEAQARLRRSEELLRTATANTEDTLLLVDPGFEIRFVNRELCGLPPDVIVGRELGSVLPDHARAGIIARLQRVLATGETATFDYHDSAAGLGTEYFENRAALVRDESFGTAISITMHNVTERKRLEQEILEASGRERHSIGRDLHDGLGQELTGVSLMLRSLASRLETRCPDAKPEFDEIVAVVNQSIDNARALARGLMPVNAAGLAAALRALAERNQAQCGFEVECRISVSAVRPLDDATATHLYRIAQEALTNAARHAHASKVTLFLLVSPAKFLLRITDDGGGVSAELAGGASAEFAPRAGMGLKIMRYRAGMIGATFEIICNQPRGTVICVAGQQSPVQVALPSAYAL